MSTPGYATRADGTVVPVEPITALATTDISGTITTGGTAQTLLAANSGVSKLRLVNPPGALESLWYSEFGAAAVSGPNSQELAAGAEHTFDPPLPAGVSIIAATTGHAFTAVKY